MNNVSVLGGINLTAIVPTFTYPVMSKQLPSGAVWERTENNTYYFDDSIPFGGIYIDYVNAIAQLSNGDIQNDVMFTHTSRGSLKRYTSAYTAAVQDVENGLADMAVGPFWITRQRLKMTTFTVPLSEFMILYERDRDSYTSDQYIWGISIYLCVNVLCSCRWI